MSSIEARTSHERNGDSHEGFMSWKARLGVWAVEGLAIYGALVAMDSTDPRLQLMEQNIREAVAEQTFGVIEAPARAGEYLKSEERNRKLIESSERYIRANIGSFAGLDGVWESGVYASEGTDRTSMTFAVSGDEIEPHKIEVKINGVDYTADFPLVREGIQQLVSVRQEVASGATYTSDPYDIEAWDLPKEDFELTDRYFIEAMERFSTE